jgi:hypothetical protein
MAMQAAEFLALGAPRSSLRRQRWSYFQTALRHFIANQIRRLAGKTPLRCREGFRLLGYGRSPNRRISNPQVVVDNLLRGKQKRRRQVRAVLLLRDCGVDGSWSELPIRQLTGRAQPRSNTRARWPRPIREHDRSLSSFTHYRRVDQLIGVVELLRCNRTKFDAPEQDLSPRLLIRGVLLAGYLLFNVYYQFLTTPT